MKYKVKISSSNADHDTSQSSTVEFVDAATGHNFISLKTLASYHSSRFTNGKVRVTLYDRNGKAWPKEFPIGELTDRQLWDICVAHCNELGYSERQN